MRWQPGQRGPRARLAALLACTVAAVALPGCQRTPEPAPASVSDTVERGPLKLTVTAAPREVWFGDPIDIELVFETPEDYAVQLPDASDLTGLTVQKTETPEPRPGPAGGLVWVRRFTAISFSSGELQVPPLTVSYEHKPPAASSAPAEGASRALDNELTTHSLKLTVRSALTSQDSVMNPRDITGTLSPRWPRALWPWLVLGGAVLIAALIVILLVLLIRRRLRRPPPPVLPEVWALRQLERLSAEEWFSDERLREYFYQLTHVVGAYVEMKFGLAAREMTTEEFLRTVARDAAALPYERGRLREFLSACDAVKYAALHPRRADGEQALATARAFVQTTAAAAALQAEAQTQAQAEKPMEGHVP